MRTTQQITTKLCSYIPLVMVITWLDFGGILLETLFLPNVLRKFQTCFFKVKHFIGHISGMVGPIDVKQKGGASVGYWVNYVTFTFDLIHDLDLWFFKVKFQNSCIWGIVIWLMWNKTKANQLDTGLTVWSCPLSTPMTLTFKGQSLKWPYLRNGGGGADWHGKKGLWVNLSWPWLWPMGKHGGVGGCTA